MSIVSIDAQVARKNLLTDVAGEEKRVADVPEDAETRNALGVAYFWSHNFEKADQALRTARTCYDHLAGWLAVTLADRLSARQFIVLSDGAAAVTEEGRRFFHDFGLALDDPRSARPLCRTCLDWSERRSHLAGRLGAGLCQRCLDLGWIKRSRDSRAVTFTPKGIEGFRETFGITLP